MYAQNNIGDQPLHRASFHGHDIVKLLLDRGVNVNAQTNTGMQTIRKAAFQGWIAIVSGSLAIEQMCMCKIVRVISHYT